MQALYSDYYFPDNYVKQIQINKNIAIFLLPSIFYLSCWVSQRLSLFCFDQWLTLLEAPLEKTSHDFLW